MTTSRIASAWTESVNAEVASKKTIGYLRAQYRNKLHQIILLQFLKAEASGFSRTKMATKIGKRKEVITRLLSAPGNWTLDTVSDLMLALGGRPSTAFESFIANIPNTENESPTVQNLPDVNQDEDSLPSIADAGKQEFDNSKQSSKVVYLADRDQNLPQSPQGEYLMARMAFR